MPVLYHLHNGFFHERNTHFYLVSSQVVLVCVCEVLLTDVTPVHYLILLFLWPAHGPGEPAAWIWMLGTRRERTCSPRGSHTDPASWLILPARSDILHLLWHYLVTGVWLLLFSSRALGFDKEGKPKQLNHSLLTTIIKSKIKVPLFKHASFTERKCVPVSVDSVLREGRFLRAGEAVCLCKKCSLWGKNRFHFNTPQVISEAFQK